MRGPIGTSGPAHALGTNSVASTRAMSPTASLFLAARTRFMDASHLHAACQPHHAQPGPHAGRLMREVEQNCVETDNGPQGSRRGHTRSKRSCMARRVQDRQVMNAQRWSALAVMLCAVFLAAVDFNVVTIAIPSIQRGLGTNFGEIQLIVAGYALSFAVLLITGGRLGDLYGRRRMYTIGMAGFTIASALCGFAPSPTALIASRVLQGAFAAGMVPHALAVFWGAFTPRAPRLGY